MWRFYLWSHSLRMRSLRSDIITTTEPSFCHFVFSAGIRWERVAFGLVDLSKVKPSAWEKWSFRGSIQWRILLCWGNYLAEAMLSSEQPGTFQNWSSEEGGEGMDRSILPVNTRWNWSLPLPFFTFFAPSLHKSFRHDFVHMSLGVWQIRVDHFDSKQKCYCLYS